MNKIFNKFDHEEMTSWSKQWLNSFKKESTGTAVVDATYRGASIIGLITAIINALYNRDSQSLMILAIAVLVAGWFNRTEIIKYVKFFIDASSGFAVAQGRATDQIIHGLVFLVTGSIFLHSEKKNLPEKILQHISNLGRYKLGIESIFKWVVDLASMLLEKIDYANVLPHWVKYFYVKDAEIMSYLSKVDDMTDKIRLNKFPFTDENYSVVQQLFQEGRHLQLQVARGDASLSSVMVTHQGQLVKLRDAFIASNYLVEGLRQVPASMWLVGAPGTWKSQSLQYFSAALNAATLTEEQLKLFEINPDKYTYNRMAEHEYWDGYTPFHHVCVMDDIFQIKDIAGNPDCEAMNWIRMNDEFQYPVHMAEIHKKGVTHFKSAFCIATTNMINFKLESIYEPKAVLRRIDMGFYVVPKEEFRLPLEEGEITGYSKWKGDESKLPIDKKTGFTILDPRIIAEYHEFDPKTGLMLNRICTFDEVVKRMLAVYTENKFRFQKKKEMLKETVAEWKEINPHVQTIQTGELHVGVETFSFRPHSGSSFSKILDRVSNSYSFFRPNDTAQVLQMQDAIVEQYEEAHEDVANIKPSCEDWTAWNNIVAQDFILDIERDKDFLESGEDLETVRSIYLKALEENEQLNILVVNLNTLVLLVQQGRAVTKLDSGQVYTHYNSIGESFIFCGCSFNRIFDRLYRCVDNPVKFLTQSRIKGTTWDKILEKMSEYEPIKTETKDIGFVNVLGQGIESAKENVLSRVFTAGGRSFKHCVDWMKENPGTMGAIIGGLAGLSLAFKFFGSPFNKLSESLPSFQGDVWVTNKKPVPEPIVKEGKIVDSKGNLHEPSSLGIYQKDDGTWGWVDEKPEEEEDTTEFQGLYHSEQRTPTKLSKLKQIARSHKGSLKQKAQELAVAQMKFCVPQMAYTRDKSGCELVDKYIHRNVYEIYTIDDEGNDVSGGFVTFIVGTVILMPYHFLQGYLNRIEDGVMTFDTPIRFSRWDPKSEKYRNFFVPMIDMFLNCEHNEAMISQDVVLCKLPDYVNYHSCIIDMFPTEEELSSLREFPVRLIVPRGRKWEMWVDYAKVIHDLPVGFEPRRGAAYKILRAYEYKAPTSVGDCGAWLTLVNPRFPKSKILGIHVGGTVMKGGGYACALTRKIMEDNLGFFEMKCDKHAHYVNDDLPLPDVVIAQGQFMEQYQVKKGIIPPYKSQIIRSSLYRKWGDPLTAPALLHARQEEDGTVIDPWDKALSKFCTDNIRLKLHTIDIVTNSLFDDLARSSDNTSEKRIFTFEEAVLGLRDDPTFKSIARNTSAGYPRNVEKHSLPKRKYLFGDDDDYNLDRPECKELRLECEDIIDKARKGIRTEFIYSDNLKDERRPLEKVKNGATRLFSASPIDLLIVYRMYFGDFVVWFTRNKMRNGSAVGVNPYSDEWNFIARQLLNMGSDVDPCIGAGDYSKFDGSQKPEIHFIILVLINRWYNDGPDNQKIRKTLWLEITCSKHIVKDVVYTWPSSLPSGNPLTTVINTLYNLIAMRYCWEVLVPGESCLFYKYVYVICMGDDHVFSVHPDYRHLFNEMTLGKAMAELGLTYTNETKTESVVPLRKINEVEFLKRSFRYDDGVGKYLAPLRLDVVTEMPYWTKKESPRQITIDNTNTAIRELTLHGRKVFEEWTPIMARQLKDHCDEYPECTIYSVLQDRVVNSDSF